MSKETTLGYYDPNKTTKVFVDGSKKDGIGSILAQYNEDKQVFQPIRYNSRPLSDPETRYSQIEIESLAVYYGVSKNYIYLYGLTEFEVVTDHMPLLNLYNKHKETMPPRVAHHKIMLQGYNYQVTYQKGKDNPADYMSRHPIQGEE